MGKLKFCEDFVFLDRDLISFEGRPYLPAIYGVTARNLVLRCSRQTEKSTFLVNTLLFAACTSPGIQILFVSPRMEQARLFSNVRLLPAIEQSPLIRRTLLGTRKQKLPVMNLEFANGSRVFVRASYHNADSARGISADLLLVDEMQDIAPGSLPVLQETLSHSLNRRIILTGTPKSVDNHLEGIFNQSTANEWTVTCSACRKGTILNEHALGPHGIVCPDCGQSLDPTQGRWESRNPEATWGDGYWINHAMVPWVNYCELADRQRTYDPAQFKNEVLGLPSALGDHVVTRTEMEACCTELPMAKSIDEIPAEGRGHLIAGIDWGGGGVARTVIVIGFMRPDFSFQICHMDRFPGREEPDRILSEVTERCRRFQVCCIAADGGGNGHVYNRLLLERVDQQVPFVAILYSASDHAPAKDGALIRWTVNRSATIGGLFTRVKKRLLVFPRVEDVSSYLDEFACEVAEYDDQQRAIKYTHPETQQDDALHATNYALWAGFRRHQQRSDLYY
jgi:hypothetical protein